MCIGSTPKQRPPTIPKAPTMADTAVADAQAAERRNSAGGFSTTATDVTKGTLSTATTEKKTALGA